MSEAGVPNPPDPPAPDEPAPKKPGAIATRKAQVERLIESARTTIESKRETSMPIGVAYDTYGRDISSGGAVLAAALAFRIFLFYVPYAFFIVFTFGVGADAADESGSQAALKAGMGGLLARAVNSTQTESNRTRIVVIALSGYALYIGARGVVKVLRIVHGLVWDVPVPRLRKSWRAALILILAATVAIALSVAIGALRSHLLIGFVAALVLYTLVPFGVWLYVSWLLPHPPLDLWALVPGCVLFGLGLEALHVFTIVYFPHLVNSKSETFGAIGIALVVLFWAYLIGRLMALSAVLNAALFYRHQNVQQGPSDGIGGPAAWRGAISRGGGLFGFRTPPNTPVDPGTPEPPPTP